MTTEPTTLSSRREFLFLYDIKMGNPNGDPDENRPRVLPDGTHYVTDVRLKRFARDFMKQQGHEILVDTVEGRTTNLTGRVARYLAVNDISRCEGEELVRILLDSFVDARLFGSSLAFKPQTLTPEEGGAEGKKPDKWEPKPVPKTLTGPVQIAHGEVLHRAQEVDIHGTSVFGSQEEKKQGTFTTYFALRYALIGFHGVANEHSAQLSRMSDEDYALLLKALWHGVRAAANTRTKRGQVPRLLVSIEYKPDIEFQFGNLIEYARPEAANGKPEVEWSSPRDYDLDLAVFIERLRPHADKIASLSYCISPDLNCRQKFTEQDAWELPGVAFVNLDFDEIGG